MGVEWSTAEANAALNRGIAGLEGGSLLRPALMAFVNSTMKTAPVKTGTLRRSIRINSISSDAGTYGPHVVYAAIQDRGGEIHVRTKKVLANRRTGEFFGKKVTIPAQHYMQRGGEAGLGDAQKRVASQLRVIFNG